MNFIRCIDVKFYSRETKKCLFAYQSTGSRSEANISFSCTRTMAGDGESEKCEFDIWGMNPDRRRWLVSNYQDVVVSLSVGYKRSDEQIDITNLFTGLVSRVWWTKEGMDSKTTISLYARFDVNGRISLVIPPRTALKEVIQKMVDQISSQNKYSEIKFSPLNIQLTGTTSPTRHYTLSGTFVSCINELADDFGFTWTIQNYTLYAYEDRSSGRESCRSNFKIGRHNLLSCEPILVDGIGMVQSGMKIEAILNPSIIPGSTIELESAVYPEYNGRYLIDNIDFTGGVFGGDWKMTLEAKTPVQK